MPVRVDHISLPTRDTRASAEWFADLLGLCAPEPDGPEGEFLQVRLNADTVVLFAPGDAPASVHVAFHVDVQTFQGAVAKLKRQSIPIGNDPDNLRNGETADPLGGTGRVYFTDRNGHLFELVA